MRKDEGRSYNKFLRTLLAIQLDQLRAFLAGTPASTLVDGKIEKTAISIRSVLTNYVKAMRYLQGIDRPGREKFTIREWMKGQADKSKNGWTFFLRAVRPSGRPPGRTLQLNLVMLLHSIPARLKPGPILNC